MSDFRNVAHYYWKQGLNIVLVRAKKPLLKWKQWQCQRQTEVDFQTLPWSEADGFALIGGSKLDNDLHIAAVDFDVKSVSEEAKKRGLNILKKLPITQIERTVSNGQHWVYYCRRKPGTISAYHDDCAVELLGEKKLIIMAPTHGYKRLNDNPPTIIQDIEVTFYQALQRAGVHHGRRKCRPTQDPVANPYYGRKPPCIAALMKGVKQGTRNEVAIRVAGYLLNFKKFNSKKAWVAFNRWNRRNKPPLDMDELGVIFNSALRGQYDFGCDDPLLNQFCNEDACSVFHRRMQAFKRSVAAL